MLFLLSLLFHFMHITATNVTLNYSHLRSYSHRSLYLIHTCFFKWLFSLFYGKILPFSGFCITHWFFLLKLSDPQAGFASAQYLTLMETRQQIPRRIFENSSFGIIIVLFCSLSPWFFLFKGLSGIYHKTVSVCTPSKYTQLLTCALF